MIRVKAVMAIVFLIAMVGSAFGFSKDDVVQITFSNKMGAEIEELYFAGSDTDQWGADILNSTDTMANNAQLQFWVHPGTYDLMAVIGDKSYLLMEYEIKGTKTITINKTVFKPSDDIPKNAKRVPITVNNKTGQTVRFLFLAPHDSENWGPDVLRKGINLTNGTAAEFNVLIFDPNEEVQYDLYGISSDLKTVWKAVITIKKNFTKFTQNLVP